jgi:hypothetical protein
MYLATADGGRAITDAASETYHIINMGRSLAGLPPAAPKQGARFHFELPGSVQGFTVEESAECHGVARVENVTGHSRSGARSLAVHFSGVAPGRKARVATPTFIPSRQTADYFIKRGYALYASPTLYSGQTIRACVSAERSNSAPVQCCLYVAVYDASDALTLVRSPGVTIAPGADHDVQWRIPSTDGQPIAAVGLEISHMQRADGVLYLDYLTWEGAPEITLQHCAGDGVMWRRAWVNGVDQYEERWPEAFRLVQNSGRGLFSQGCREWGDYTVSSEINLHLVKAAGLAARVQGMRRYYALLLCNDGKARLIKTLDGDTTLAEADFPWAYGQTYNFTLKVRGRRIHGEIDGQLLLTADDNERPLMGGGVAFVVEEGRIASEAVSIAPLPHNF